MLSASEYQEFTRVLRATGHAAEEFEISEAFFVGRKRTYPSVSTVVVRWIPKNTYKTYVAGYGTYWLLSFENDVENGSFGNGAERARG